MARYSKKENLEFHELKSSVRDLRNDNLTPEEIKGCMQTLTTMFDPTPADNEKLQKLLDEYKESIWDIEEEQLDDKPGVPICTYFDNEARENLMDYLDEHYDGNTDWNKIYDVIKNDNIMVNRYYAFIEDRIEKKSNVENDNKTSNNVVDFSFGFTDEERHLMYMHFNGTKFNRELVVGEDGRKRLVFPDYLAEKVYDKECFLEELKECYTLEGYGFDWDSFENKILSMRQDQFIKLIKYLIVEWVDLKYIVYCFMAFGLDVSDFIEWEIEKLNEDI